MAAEEFPSGGLVHKAVVYGTTYFGEMETVYCTDCCGRPVLLGVTLTPSAALLLLCSNLDKSLFQRNHVLLAEFEAGLDGQFPDSTVRIDSLAPLDLRWELRLSQCGSRCRERLMQPRDSLAPSHRQNQHHLGFYTRPFGLFRAHSAPGKRKSRTEYKPRGRGRGEFYSRGSAFTLDSLKRMYSNEFTEIGR